ncbi:hypothetical protein TWF481_011199 [Arthrobotrys musiformis]|uniref:Uncharacterized protein n=1 Tax=Arthrobotrys musiformis TaxID=47236 RepID=A0AAV9VZQ9_9PEZI
MKMIMMEMDIETVTSGYEDEDEDKDKRIEEVVGRRGGGMVGWSAGGRHRTPEIYVFCLRKASEQRFVYFRPTTDRQPCRPDRQTGRQSKQTNLAALTDIMARDARP